MDSRGSDFSLDRNRLYSGTPNPLLNPGLTDVGSGSLSSVAARHGALTPAEVARASTPAAAGGGMVDPLAPHYASRYGLPPPPALPLHSPPGK